MIPSLIPSALHHLSATTRRASRALGTLATLAALHAGLAKAYTVPNSTDLLFGLNTDSLPATGNAGPWTRTDPAGGTFNNIGAPTIDAVGTAPVKWVKNTYTTATGFNGGTQAAAIPINGATIVAAVKPLRSADTGNWRSIVDVLYDQFCLIINNATGQLGMRRSGTMTWGPAAAILPDQQSSVVSVVMAANGSYRMFVNGTLVWDNTATVTMTQFNRSGLNSWGIGRNTFDGWSTYNGNIGDVYVWKSALDDTTRASLENDLMAKFHATPATYPPVTITATASATGGTISPSGTLTVAHESDRTFTITPSFGYAADVRVNGSSIGNVTSHTFTDVSANQSIEAVFTPLPTRTISGNVTAKAGGGATVSVKPTSQSLPSLQTTTDTAGNFSLTVPEGAYAVCASQTGYMISADATTNPTGPQTLNFTLSAKRNLPKMEFLLFAADSNDLGSVGTSEAWPLMYCTYPSISSLTRINTPTTEKVRGIKYSLNQRAAPEDGYRLNTTITNTPIPVNGATIVSVVKPIRNAVGDGYNAIVDIFYNNVRFGIFNGGTNAGKVYVNRNNAAFTSTTAIPDGQLTILSLVIQPDGTWKVWASPWNATANKFDAATVFFSSTATSAFPAFVPAQFGTDDYRKWINVGRNNPDGWSAFNGYIGDTFVFKTALSDSDRATIEADINTKTTSIPAYNITATAGPNGSITPAGVTSVGESDSQSYTITPNFGYQIANVVVDGANKGALTSFLFENVTAPHTIEASFSLLPVYAVSGRITGTGGVPVSGATVYISTQPNASVSPFRTVTTNADGQFSTNLFNGTWYVTTSASGYTTAADSTVTVANGPVSTVDQTLSASGRHIPRMDQLLFALYSQDLTPNGATTAPWPLEHPKGVNAAVIGTPTLTTIGTLQWEQNRYASGDGYRIGQYTSPIPINGLTATAVIQPTAGNGTDGGNWTSIIDVMYNRLVLGIRGTTGELVVMRNGIRNDSGVIIPNNQKTILTLTVQPDGQYQVFANGLKVIDVTATSPMPTLDPLWNGGGTGFWSFINVGRNNPDGWTTYQGLIGNAFLWKTALTPLERITFETSLGNRYDIAMPVYHNLTASAGTGGSISPAGTVPVIEGSSQTFTIQPDIGFSIQGIAVDDVPMGATDTYTIDEVKAPHTIHATFAAVPQYTVSGTVRDRTSGLPVSGATVHFSASPNAFLNAYTTATTDASGNFSKSLYAGNVHVSTTQTGYYNSPDTTIDLAANTPGVNLVIAPATRNTPAADKLLLAALTETLPQSGNIPTWNTTVPATGSLTPIANPAVAIAAGQRWSNNLRSTQTGYRLGQYSDPIPCEGATILAVVKPSRNGISDAWSSVVDVFYDRLVLGVRNDNGLITVRCNGSNTTASGMPLADGEVAIISLVVAPDGSYRVFANGYEVPFTNNGPLVGGLAALTPGVTGGPGGYGTYINLGRNNPDGWSTFNGLIGDVFIYTSSLTQEQRMTLEQDAAAKYGITLPVYHTITATAGPNGSISPQGAAKVAEGQDQTFSFNPAPGFTVEDVVVDGESMGPNTNYVFFGVDAPHTIHVTFVNDPGQDGYGNWITNWFTPGEPDAAKNADPDGDGRTNLLEYALDDDPSTPEASPKARLELADVDGTKALVITFPVLDASSQFEGQTSKTNVNGSVLYTVEGSNGLDGFNEVVTEITPARSEGLEPPFPGWSYRSFRLAGPVPARGKAGFLRVGVKEANP